MMAAAGETALRMARGRTALLLDHPFFGALILRLKLVEVDWLDTMATDGASLFFNARFVAGLSDPELVGVLAHEVMHPALQHHTRRGDRDAELWNVACDYAINPILLQAEMKLPTDCLNDPKFANMAAEEIYAAIARQTREDSGKNDPSADQKNGGDDEQNSGAGTGRSASPRTAPSTPGGFGQVLDAPDPADPARPASPAQKELQAQEWRIAVEQAQRAAAIAGKVPAGLERLIDVERRSEVDWREALRRFLSQTVPQDYRWTPPNRCFASLGIYLPSLYREGLGEIAVAIDTSGSITDDLLAAFAGELSAIASEARPERIHVMYCDASVERVDEFANGEPIELKAVGGGGTDFRPVFEHIEDNRMEPRCLIYLTDLAGKFPDEEPAFPVLWAATTDRTPPFGEKLRIFV
jgi:predicted metal-dependent peptidase